MTDTITKPRVSAAAKTALALAAAAVLLAVFALAAPGSRFFFPLVSLWCNLALFACVLLVLRVAGIKFDLFHKAVIVGLWAAALISLTNLTSAGQFAGLSLIASTASYIEMAITQLIINLRYCLMSFSLSQKLEKGVSNGHRLAVAFGVTDEIFGVSASQDGRVSPWYNYGAVSYTHLTLPTIA